MKIMGSEYLSIVLHAISQSFMIPVLIGLIGMAIFAFMELGSFLGEKRNRKKNKWNLYQSIKELYRNNAWKRNAIYKVLEKMNMDKLLYEQIVERTNDNLEDEVKRIMYTEILNKEECRMQKKLDRTDLLVKTAPFFGLMGTLIPLGPGLAALGEGNINALSSAIIVAFDTTVVGVATGAVAAIISKVRRRWYYEDLNNLEMVLELLVYEGGKESAKKQEKKIVE